MVSFKRFTRVAVSAVLGAALLLSACGGQESADSGEEIEAGTESVENPDAYDGFEETVSGEAITNELGITAEYGYPSSYGLPREEKGDEVRSYLTGKWVPKSVGERRPVAVMLNNIEVAQPMSGTSAADIFYECVVEGSLTRIMGIFENYDDLEKIGSVRSCRDYFLYYALEYDAIYCHYGQAVYAQRLLGEPYVNNLSGLAKEGNVVYYRTTTRVAPHNAYASAKGIKKGIEMLGYDNDYSPKFMGKFTFAHDGDIIVPKEDDCFDASHVEPGYLINKPWFEYNADDKKYYRFQYGGPQIDEETGEQLAVDNIILQYSAWDRLDDNDYLVFDCHSGGKMTYITNGRARPGTWKRFGGDEGATRYFDAEGKEMVVNQGKTWVMIIQDTAADKVVIR
ncbi:MAG: DUF3048 domain-containing protein [Lachnospiraceae bacterium]|nr:DUF3048 domain-containing protein [Lachnospiraceae bacterium]